MCTRRPCGCCSRPRARRAWSWSATPCGPPGCPRAPTPSATPPPSPWPAPSARPGGGGGGGGRPAATPPRRSGSTTPRAPWSRARTPTWCCSTRPCGWWSPWPRAPSSTAATTCSATPHPPDAPLPSNHRPSQQKEESMSSSRRHRLSAVLALAVALGLGVAACGGSSDDGGKSSAQTGPRTLSIWLMEGSAPPAVGDAVNADWKKAHPNDTVKVELQQWNNITTKLDAAFAGSSPPDVVELGNTLVSKYAAAGALQDLTASRDQFENNQAWLQ